MVQVNCHGVVHMAKECLSSLRGTLLTQDIIHGRFKGWHDVYLVLRHNYK
jgi:hypothetical protein